MPTIIKFLYILLLLWNFINTEHKGPLVLCFPLYQNKFLSGNGTTCTVVQQIKQASEVSLCTVYGQELS
jgi:hypothetical protein